VIAANRRPDHWTIARFRQRHEVAIGELFGGVLAWCAEAGLVRVGVVAIAVVLSDEVCGRGDRPAREGQRGHHP